MKRTFNQLEDKLFHQLDEPFRSRALQAAYHVNNRLDGDPGCYLIIRDAYRFSEDQLKLWQRGRLFDGKKWVDKQDPNEPVVTHARPGRSAHEYRRAIHLILIDKTSKAWLGNSDKRWHIIGEEAEKSGLEWGGSWPKLRDYAHVEDKTWREVAQFFGWAGMTPTDRFDITEGGKVKLSVPDID